MKEVLDLISDEASIRILMKLDLNEYIRLQREYCHCEDKDECRCDWRERAGIPK